MNDTFWASLAAKVKLTSMWKNNSEHTALLPQTMIFVLYVYFPSVCIYGCYLGSLLNVSYVPAMLPSETSPSDKERLSLTVNFSSAAFKRCPTEEKDADSNFTRADLMQRNWTTAIDSTIPEQTVAGDLWEWMPHQPNKQVSSSWEQYWKPADLVSRLSFRCAPRPIRQAAGSLRHWAALKLFPCPKAALNTWLA